MKILSETYMAEAFTLNVFEEKVVGCLWRFAFGFLGN
jgi:hypothetical protein